MSHVWHQGLPTYDDQNVLHDGCQTCEERAESLSGLLALDAENVTALWDLMLASQYGSEPIHVMRSVADTNASRVLYELAVFLERNSDLDPWRPLGLLAFA